MVQKRQRKQGHALYANGVQKNFFSLGSNEHPDTEDIEANPRSAKKSASSRDKLVTLAESVPLSN